MLNISFPKICRLCMSKGSFKRDVTAKMAISDPLPVMSPFVTNLSFYIPGNGTFKPELEKYLKIHPPKNSYTSGNGTLWLQD